MIKPLLRTIPTISGNVKLACSLNNYNTIDKNTVEASVNGARLLPLSSSLYQKHVEAGLLASSWEYDLKKFFSYYSDVFFKSYFNINDKEIQKLDTTSNLYTRNTDFEYGVKRVSYLKNGYQYTCFAPIYIDNAKDIPSYFLLNVKFDSGEYVKVKNLRINIGINKTATFNYLYTYLNRYLSKIDDNVIFMNGSNKNLTYYAIDLTRGGFTKKVNASASCLFNTQLPINYFDDIIAEGFSNNKLCMKQSLPLAFYFNVDELLTESEKELFKFANITFSGNYYDADNNKLDWYDFDWDYIEHKENIIGMNPETGKASILPGKINNIMDCSFPSFNECRLIEYQFSNKLTAVYNRWKLKYSSDEMPYTINASWSFSANQGSNYKYGSYPHTFPTEDGLAVIDENNRYDLVFPFNYDKHYYDVYDINESKRYRKLFEDNCLSWFTVLKDNDIKNKNEWSDITDEKTFHNRVFYSFSDVYSNNNIDDADKLDKFGVFCYINSYIYSEEYIKENFLYSDIVIADSKHTTISNTSVNNNIQEQMLTNYSYGTYVFNTIKDLGGLYDTDIIFEKTSRNDTAQKYINIEELNTYLSYTNSDYYRMNRYFNPADIYVWLKNTSVSKYSLDDVKQYCDNDTYSYAASHSDMISAAFKIAMDKTNLTQNSLETNPIYSDIGKEFWGTTYSGKDMFEFMPVYDKFMCVDDGKSILTYNVSQNVKDNLYINYGSNVELAYNGKTFDINTSESKLYDNLLYYKHKFVNNYDVECNKEKDIDIKVLYQYCNYDSSIKQNYPWNNIDNIGSSTYYLYKLTNAVIKFLADKLIENTEIIEYEFVPEKKNENKAYANNVICKRNSYTGKFYGNETTLSRIEKSNKRIKYADNDVLYVSKYNMTNVLKKYAPGKSISALKKDTFFAKMLDNTFLYIYFDELCKNEKLVKPANVYDNVYVQEKVFVNTANGFEVQYKYTPIVKKFSSIDNFIKSVKYDSSTDMFYIINENNYKKTCFNICFLTEFYRLDKTIWDIINVNGLNNFVDVYVWRPLKESEFEQRWSTSIKMKYEDNQSTDSIYTGCDSMLFPMFNDTFNQQRQETEFYYNFVLDNISEVNFGSYKNYRYNSNSAAIMLAVSDSNVAKLDPRINIYKFHTVLNSENLSDIKIVENELNYPENIGINTFVKDGKRYGYYLINVNIDNTSKSLNMKGFMDKYGNVNKIVNIVNDLKYITRINHIDIVKNPNYVNEIFVQLYPFVYTSLFEHIYNKGVTVTPTSMNLDMIYRSFKYKDTEETDLFVLKNNAHVKKTMQIRYLDNVVPIIKKTDVVKNQHELKFKNVDATLLDTGKLNIEGDSVLYKHDNYIDMIPKYNIYGLSNNASIKSYNNIVDTYTPLEYKHYNCSKYVNLPVEIIVDTYKKHTYDELIKLESDDIVFNVFKTEVLRKQDLIDNEVLFLYKKYRVEYLTESVGLNFDGTTKLYTLKYKFTLL